jgi:hypothetical protein
MLIFCVSVPFIGSPKWIAFNLVVLLAVLSHWILNNNVCFLTLIEKFVRGTPDDDRTFFGRLFGKFYTYGKDDKTSWYIIILLILISVIKSRSYIKELIDNYRK